MIYMKLVLMFDLNAYKAKNCSWCFKTQMKKLPSLSNLFLHFQMCFESKYSHISSFLFVQIRHKSLQKSCM